MLSTSLATYGPVAGAAGAVALGVRSIPAQAWDAFGKVLTAWVNRRAAARVEFDFGDGRRLTVENDPRAVRQALEEVVLPEVRKQQVTRHDQWQRLLDTPTPADAVGAPGTEPDGEAGSTSTG